MQMAGGGSLVGPIVVAVLSVCCVVYLYIWSTIMAGANEAATGSNAAQIQADVVIVGAGLAGLSASIEAATLHPTGKVVVIEREPKVGGNSAKASSGINGAISDDDYPVFEQDTLKSGGGLSNEQLVDVFVKKSPSAIEFLKQNEVDLSVLCQLGGHSAKRTHRNKSGPNVGFAIISALQKRIAQISNIEILTGSTADKFLVDDSKSKVSGLQIKQTDGALVHIRSPAIILATGGFSSNQQLLKRFSPGMEEFPTTNGPTAQGDGILMAEELGADLVLMDKVQLHPTGFINPKDRNAQQKFLAPEAIRGSGALLLNTEGKRFVNELSTRDLVSQAILAQPGKTSFLWLFEGAKALESSLGFYKHIGLVKQVASVREAAEYCHFEADDVLIQLNAYAQIAAGETPDPFGKTVFPYPLEHIDTIDSPEDIHVMEIAPAVHYCMGGVKINAQTQVVRADGAPIAGVYAAGEVSGGLHGANRLGGNSLAECVVFGRIAGQQAVQHVLQAHA
ncbi:hypothetical protein Poli38472_002535 [Pythium oligandrum]|uniref:fumarate reductase (NADH) n=1 Tax=Pythium oligandrum TaxID=41045 RepID=A0A8K1CHC9_PYTOL|nr:hypothetical protein Poli38472_002535 [Pythium oligandrum]|eukprot:TMW63594.1 hypothetical protein Poli38472_002535 [Pythium oligandrum]